MKVMKLGGSLLDDAARRAEILRAIAAQWNRGEQIVLVHGGGKRAVVVSVIDNLQKGAASQAVQNFNRMCGFAETEALA